MFGRSGGVDAVPWCGVGALGACHCASSAVKDVK